MTLFRLARRPLVAFTPVLLLLMSASARAQVPSEYADLYASLDRQLDAFDRSLAWDGARYPVTFATELLTANGNRGRALLPASALIGARLELDRLRALNVKAVTIAIPWPILDPAVLAWNGDPADRQPLVDFFAQVVREAHARGMKLVVENGVMFGGIYSAGSGMNAAGYYATLSDPQLVAGRAAQVVAIVSQILPDLINVGSEPDTEAALTGHAFLNTPAGFAGMVQAFLAQLSAASLTSVPVVAGAGSWLYQASSFVAELCKLPALWGIDIHLYPVNRNFPDQAIALAAQAHVAGKHVTMLECWLQKERDSELATLQSAVDATLFARDSFRFWAPLDQKFLSVMVRYANASKVDYLSPFWSRYFFAYLTYPSPGLDTTDEIVAAATSAHAQALTQGLTTDTGRFYASLIPNQSTRSTVTKLVPIVLDAGGAGGARFTTELTLANRGSMETSVRLDYTPAVSLGASGPGGAAVVLGPGLQKVIPDVLGFLRGEGVLIPSSLHEGGTLRATFMGLSSSDVAFAGGRTTTPSGTGRAGVATPAVDAVEATAATSFVYGLRSTADDRSNLALVNADTAGPVTLRVALYSGADGRSVTLVPDTTLGPGQWTQIGDVLAPLGSPNGYARIDVVSGTGPYLAYGVFNDNATNDGSFVPSELAALPAAPRYVPVLVESAMFRSELVLTNPTPLAVTASVSYVESASPAAGAGGAAAVLLQPGEQRIIPDAIDFLRKSGGSIAPRGLATLAGAAMVEFFAGTSRSRGFAGARTGAPAPGGGAYGLFASGFWRPAESETWIFGLQQNATSRSNLAVATFGTSPGTAVFRVDVYDGDTGHLAGSTAPFTLVPGGWMQLNSVLAPFDVSNGYARVVWLSGSASFFAYGVVNDGASPASGATNDGSYVAPTSY